MYNPRNPYYIKIDSTEESVSYKQLHLSKGFHEQEQLQLIRVFDLPSDDFVTEPSVTYSMDDPYYQEYGDEEDVTISITIPSIPDRTDDIILEVIYNYIVGNTNATAFTSVTLISPLGTQVVIAELMDPVDGNLRNIEVSIADSYTGEDSEDWAGEWKLIFSFLLPFGGLLRAYKTDYTVIGTPLELTSKEAETIYTLPNEDSSGSSMYSLEAISKTITFSKESDDYIWKDGVHHDRGEDIQLPIITDDDNLILRRKTPAVSLIQTWTTDDALGSKLMNQNLAQILFLDTEFIKRFIDTSLRPFKLGTGNAYTPIEYDSNDDLVVLQKFFPDSISTEQSTSFFPASQQAGVGDVTSQNCWIGQEINGPFDLCSMPAIIHDQYWFPLTGTQRYFNVNFDNTLENGSLVELWISIEHPDIRDLKISVANQAANSYYKVKNYGELNESGGITNLTTSFGYRDHNYKPGSTRMDQFSYPAHRFVLRIQNQGDELGVLRYAEIKCFTGAELETPVTWIGQITGERLEEFGDFIDVIPRAAYQPEFRSLIMTHIDKWIPSLPFGYLAADRTGGELVKWRQADPAHDIEEGWQNKGMRFGHLLNVEAKRKIYE
jgi:hypothetical protein